MNHGQALFLVLAALAIAAEAWLSRRDPRSSYRWNETFTHLGCGALLMLAERWGTSSAGLHYFSILRRSALLHWENRAWTSWLACLVLLDLLYYAWHRLNHAFAPLWALHHVHHQAPRLNLAASFRQPAAAFLYVWYLIVPMAMLGFPPQLLSSCLMFHAAWDLWLHAARFPRLGALESLFVTPTHHRLHHARNPAYFDRNFGGIFILWDRLFGSFARENPQDPIKVGVSDPPPRENPLDAHLAGIRSAARRIFHRKPQVS